jgi:hypothetical protein
MIENDMLPFALAAGVSIAALQLSVSLRLYRFEKSVIWGCAGIVLLFGLNVYLYQIMRLEQRAGAAFESLTPEERTFWRTVYGLVCAQYLILFALFGLVFSPSG